MQIFIVSTTRIRIPLCLLYFSITFFPRIFVHFFENCEEMATNGNLAGKIFQKESSYS